VKPSIVGLTTEDALIWLEVSERFARGGNRYNLAVWVRADDRKDAATMLDNVRHHVSVQDRRDAVLMLTLTRARNDMKTLKKTLQDMYVLLTPRERKVMERLLGRRGQE
jgi:hypothetical protein